MSSKNNNPSNYEIMKNLKIIMENIKKSMTPEELKNLEEKERKNNEL